MKLNNITNIDQFFQVVESCEGNVYLVTSEGDYLNLKSQLCKFIAFSEFLTDAKLDLELKTDEPKDLYKFFKYALEGEM